MDIGSAGVLLTDPLVLFRDWFADARATSPLQHPGAVCVSTVDSHGAPDARFVDLKQVTDEGFVFCTRLDSAKGLALTRDPRVALTFWWAHIERQVRVAGTARRISDGEADSFFQQRSRDAQLISSVSQQSAPLSELVVIEQRVSQLEHELAGASVQRPREWGGYVVIPSRIEFLTFQATRMHERRLFSRTSAGWEQGLLQP
jgi:pyridoxamine 5'-phosphate oxidase